MDIQAFNFFDKNYEKPVIYEDQENDLVSFGKDNRLPYDLLNYYTNSSIHRAIIQKKTNMFNGTGIMFENVDDKIDKKTQKFIDKVNPQQNMEQLLSQIGLDFFIYGGSYLQIIWSRNGKSIVEIYHMPFYKMRSGKINSKNNVEEFYYNPSNEKTDEYRRYTMEDGLIKFVSFNTEKNKSKPQILYIKKDEPSNDYYAYPDYISSLVDLDTNVEISNFHNSALYNGFNPGMMVIFEGVEPSMEEKDTFMKGINAKYKGSDNAGRVIVFYSDGENAPQIKQLEISNMDKKFEVLEKTITNNIVSGHQIPRCLASLEQPGSLGNTKELISATQVFIESYIKPYQKLILLTINKIMNINKMSEIEILNPNMNMINTVISTDVLTTNERRNYLGYEDLEDEIKDTTEEVIEDKGDEVEITDDNFIKKIIKKIKK